ncbi:MAG: hypothetical protein ACTSP4_16470, partial [Candidatus Hodarchaeales archaeon]
MKVFHNTKLTFTVLSGIFLTFNLLLMVQIPVASASRVDFKSSLFVTSSFTGSIIDINQVPSREFYYTSGAGTVISCDS